VNLVNKALSVKHAYQVMLKTELVINKSQRG